MIRLLRRLKALLYNTFVTDCSVCHQHFYGFHAYQLNIKIKNKSYRIVCHRHANVLSDHVKDVKV